MRKEGKNANPNDFNRYLAAGSRSDAARHWLGGGWPLRGPDAANAITLTADCQELLTNGDFKTSSFPPWVSAGAVGLGPGHNFTQS